MYKFTSLDDFQFQTEWEVLGLQNQYNEFFVSSTRKGFDEYQLKCPKNTPLLYFCCSHEDLPWLEKAVQNNLMDCYLNLNDEKILHHLSRLSFPSTKFFEWPLFEFQQWSEISPTPQIVQLSEINNPDISIVSPSFDNDLRLTTALRTWATQTDCCIEIVIVDDGNSAIPLTSRIKEIEDFKSFISVIKLPRNSTRKRGAGVFRAGLARNFGTRIAKADKLFFIDSDICLPSHFLSSCLKLWREDTVFMPMRWQLTKEASERNSDKYVGIHFINDTILRPKANWELFQFSELPWSEMNEPWKWTSTFCLGISKRSLNNQNPFKKSFVNYGFEDMELGYRLWGHRLNFELLPLNTYHLHQDADHSEFRNESQIKLRLLKKSALNMLGNHPNKNVYKTLSPWLSFRTGTTLSL